MFTMKIVDSDAFLDMPLSTQCLYFHLNMRADDDGFIDNPKRVMKIVGAAEDDLKLLIVKRFVIAFDNGVMVIKHWRMHNTLSQSRYHETQYLDEKSMLKLKQNGSYSLGNGNEINDEKLIEMSKRQCRRTKDEQKTNPDIDLDLELDLELDLDKDLDIGIRVSKDTLCRTESVRRVVEEWNTLSAYGIKSISKLSNTSKRYQCLVARLKEYSIESILVAINNIRHSDFLQGKHKGKPWQITFDWFVLPNNFPKVLEGNYNNGDNTGNNNGFDLERWINE